MKVTIKSAYYKNLGAEALKNEEYTSRVEVSQREKKGSEGEKKKLITTIEKAGESKVKNLGNYFMISDMKLKEGSISEEKTGDYQLLWMERTDKDYTDGSGIKIPEKAWVDLYEKFSGSPVYEKLNEGEIVDPPCVAILEARRLEFIIYGILEDDRHFVIVAKQKNDGAGTCTFEVKDAAIVRNMYDTVVELESTVSEKFTENTWDKVLDAMKKERLEDIEVEYVPGQITEIQ